MLFQRYPAGWSAEGDPKYSKIAKGYSIRETWEAMEALLSTGLVKNIGTHRTAQRVAKRIPDSTKI